MSSQTDHSVVCNWCACNSLLINHAKTIDFQLIFNRNYVNPVNAVKFLGICIETGLGCNSHINFIADKISKCLFMLRILKVASHLIRYGHVQNRLNYGIA